MRRRSSGAGWKRYRRRPDYHAVTPMFSTRMRNSSRASSWIAASRTPRILPDARIGDRPRRSDIRGCQSAGEDTHLLSSPVFRAFAGAR